MCTLTISRSPPYVHVSKKSGDLILKPFRVRVFIIQDFFSAFKSSQARRIRGRGRGQAFNNFFLIKLTY